MSEKLQQSLFMNEPDFNQPLVYQGGSRASLTALLGSVERLLMSVICGRSSGELLAKLSQSGLWLKMYQDCFQAKMDGSFEEYSEILPKWGLMLGGVLIQPQQLEPHIDETGWRLLPTPTRSDYKGGCLRKNGKLQMRNLKEHMYIFSGERTRSIYLNPQFLENIMGFPIGWTEVNA